MKVAAKIRLSFILSAALIICAVCLMWELNHKTDQFMNQLENYDDAIALMFEISFLTGEVKNGHIERVKTQWLKAYKKLGACLEQLPDDSQLLAEYKVAVLDALQNTGDVFHKYIKNINDNDKKAILKSHLKNQIGINIRALIDTTDKVHDQLHQKIHRYHFYINSFFLAVIIFICVIFSLLAYSMHTNFIAPIIHFIDAFEEVGKGAFDVQIESQQYEEFRNMAEAFNSMVTNLRETTASRDELAKEIEERKLVESRLQDALKEVKLSNDDLEQFAYVASHDLQEPLRMVASYTQLLERRYKDKLDQDANDFIGFAVNGAKRMQKLITDLLEYSRIGTRGKALTNVDLNEVFASVLEDLSVLIKQNKVKIDIEYLPLVKGDELQLIRLFQNLIVNSIKFKRNTTPDVQIKHTLDNEYITITVKDNGIGIDSKHFERIFAIFQRLQHDDSCEGTGIGLAVCKKIVERHEGKIWLESQLGLGTTFYISLKRGDEKGD